MPLVQAPMDVAAIEDRNPTPHTGMERSRELHGERLSVPERVVVAPRIGQFRAVPPELVTAEGEIVAEGQVVGYIDAQGEQIPVRSSFRGWMMGLLAHEGERVREGQPVAWLRAL